MRATRCLLALAGAALLCSGCGATIWQAPVQPPRGAIFTQYSAPLTIDLANVPVSRKRGTATTTFFWNLAWDDASIDSAARQAGLTKVYYADYEILEIFGIYGQFTVRVYGE